MIRGMVTAEHEVIIQVSLRGPTGRVLHVQAVVDTGFSGHLSLTPASIAQLRLRWDRSAEVVLADGSESAVEIYEGTVLWDGGSLSVPVQEVDADPLVGMALLQGYELKAEVRSGGKVTIKRLPRRKRSS